MSKKLAHLFAARDYIDNFLCLLIFNKLCVGSFLSFRLPQLQGFGRRRPKCAPSRNNTQRRQGFDEIQLTSGRLSYITSVSRVEKRKK